MTESDEELYRETTCLGPHVSTLDTCLKGQILQAEPDPHYDLCQGSLTQRVKGEPNI